MKGLQGELEETLGGIKLSVSTIEKLFQSYSSCCSDLLPTLSTVGAGVGAGLPVPAPLCRRPRPPPGEGAPALGVPPLPRLQENGLLPAQAEDHRGDSTAQGMGLGAPGQTEGAVRGQTPPWCEEQRQPSSAALPEAPSTTAVPPAGLVPGRMLLGTLAHVAQPGPGAAAWAPAVPGNGEPGLGTQLSQMGRRFLLTRSCTRYPSSS